MAKVNVRVLIPRNPTELLKLAEKIYTKHTTDGATSALNALGDKNWTDNGGKIASALSINDQAKQMEKDLEELYRQRDLLVAPILSTVKASRTLLLGKYSENYKKLGDWGFVVDDTPKAKKQAIKTT